MVNIAFFMIFAVLHSSPLTLNSAVFTFIFAVLLPVLSGRLLIISINTTFFDFSTWRRPPSWIFKYSKFQLLVRFRRPMFVIVPNVVPIGQTDVEISRFLDFVGWRPLLSWIFKFEISNSSNG